MRAKIPPTFLSRFLRASGGNVMIIFAFAMLPLLMISGGGIEVGRRYLAKQQLQGACDASVLAARKFQTGQSLATQASATGQSFFKANYPAGSFGTKNASLALTVSAGGEVRGAAKVEAGDPVFKLLDFFADEISADCAANLEMGNTDVVFALDVTGSMSGQNPGDSQTRLEALRASVRDFASMLNGQVSGGTRVRFGFVPFSSTVNVGFLLRPDWIVDHWTYQSRVADTSNPINPGSTPFMPISGTVIQTQYYGQAETEPGSEITVPGGIWKCSSIPIPTTTVAASSGPWSIVPGSGGQLQQRTNTQVVNGKYYSGEIDGNKCIIHVDDYRNRTYTSTEIQRVNGGPSGPPPGLYLWIYKPVQFNVSAVKSGNRSFVVPKFSDQQDSVTVTWQGCVEERDTVRATDFSPIPTGAYDLDIDRIPTNDATRWRPFLPELVYWRRDKGDWDMAPWSTHLNAPRPIDYANGQAAACPTEARKLSTMSTQGVIDYVNSLTAGGTTYLDIGMIWAARLASPTGLFASENQSAPNGQPISRNIIFMTDGDIETHDYIYEAYGLSALDRRRTDPDDLPTDAQTDALVDARFRAACEAAKSKGISIWTIAFGTALTPTLKACSSNSQYYMAANSGQLNQTFASIAANIARLRLTK